MDMVTNSAFAGRLDDSAVARLRALVLQRSARRVAVRLRRR